MRKRLLTYLTMIAAVVALGAPNAIARPRPAADINDLQTFYFGYWGSTNGADEAGDAAFEVTDVSGSSFEGELELFTGFEELGAQGFAFYTVEGTVNAKGKVTMTFEAPGEKFSFKGALTDEGILITGKFTVKEGQTVVSKANLALIVE
jgi:hypothetical protein